MQQALDAATDEFTCSESVKVYLVPGLLKQKPSDQQWSDVHTHFNFLCKELRRLVLIYLPVDCYALPEVESFCIINSLIIINFKKALECTTIYR